MLLGIAPRCERCEKDVVMTEGAGCGKETSFDLGSEIRFAGDAASIEEGRDSNEIQLLSEMRMKVVTDIN